MDTVTVIRLEDVNGKPIAKVGGIPSPLRIGDQIGLKFQLRRTSNGRHEILDVDGPFQVKAIGFDAAVVPRRQLLSVEAVQKVPTWRSVRKPAESRPLAPAKSPKTSI